MGAHILAALLLAICALAALLPPFLIGRAKPAPPPRRIRLTRDQRAANAASTYQDLRLNKYKPRQIFHRLRAMDPYTFEELILAAFQARGFKVKSPGRYSGDGGIDGEVIINGEQFLLQMKRYSRSINPRHVHQFDDDCAKRGLRGLFVHTGRTGPASRQRFIDSAEIDVISGDRLIKLVTGGSLTRYFKRLRPGQRKSKRWWWF